MRKKYVELHARSAFSFLEGSSTPEELIAQCQEFDMPAMALLDRNGVYGAPRFHMAATKMGLRAHVGSEVSCTDGGTYPLLVTSRTGYQNLCRLITRMKLRAKKGEGAATAEEFRELSRGLIVLACEPERSYVEQLVDIFGRRNVYVELQRHYNREQEARNQALIDLARSLNLPLLATNGVSHASVDARPALDALTCVRHKVKIADAG